MANLLLKASGKYQVRFCRNNRVHSLMLATGNKKQAQVICNMVERLLSKKKTGMPDPMLDNWLATLNDDLRMRLERSGLLEKQVDHSFHAVALEYRESKRNTWKTITYNRRINEINWIFKYFDEGIELEAVKRVNAVSFLNWLVEQKMANTYINKILKMATAIFDYAVLCEYTTANNPFRGVRVPNKVQREKQYVSVDYTEKLIGAAPTVAWKTLIALLRYAGMRPEEAMLAKWEGVDWEKQTFTFESPKTAHVGKGRRMVPLFPKLQTALQKALQSATKNATYILEGEAWDRKRDSIANGSAATMAELTDFVKRAKLEAISALPTNMRGSASTDLKLAFPEYVVDTWLGHSTAIANLHYDTVQPQSVQKAITQDLYL